MSDVNYDALTDSEWGKIRSQRAVRLSIAKNSFYWFFHLYMGHYIKYPTAEFQKQMMADVTNPNIEQLVIVAFRESGKSTIITTALPLWAAIGKMQKKYIVIVSQTQNQAQQHLANIVQELETNELMQKDFWPYNVEENETGVSAITLRGLGVRIIAVSREQGVRGLRHGPHRPDLIIADDVEDSKTVKNSESRDRNYAWFTGELLPLGSENTKFITVGNLLHEDSLLMRLKAGIESGERNGVYREYPIQRNGVSLWPERFPDKASLLRLERRIADRVRFAREYLLILVPDDDQIIHHGMIHYYDELPPVLHGQRRTLAIGVDLAISEKDSADCTAMVTLDIRGRGENMRMYVLPHPINKRMQFPATMDTVRELNSAYGNPKFFVETTAYQEALVQALSKDAIDVTGVRPNQDKRTRLNMIADKIQRGVILFPKYGSKELITQLVGFGIEKHDDLVDALTIAVIKMATEEQKGGRMTIGHHPVWDNWGPNGIQRRKKSRTIYRISG